MSVVALERGASLAEVESEGLGLARFVSTAFNEELFDVFAFWDGSKLKSGLGWAKLVTGSLGELDGLNE